MSKMTLIIVIVLVVVLGGWAYLQYGGMLGQQGAQNTGYPNQQAQVAPDDTAQIEQDLTSIPTDGLDAELKSMEKEVVQ